MNPIYKFEQRCLVPLEKEFLPKLKEWRNSQMNILRQLKPLTNYNQEKWYQQLSEDKKQVMFGIMICNEKQGMKFIGYCGFSGIDSKNNRAELSFLVDPDRTSNDELYKKDFLSALYMLGRYGFEELNLNKIFTETFSFRKKHINILEDFGFHLDGVLREHHFTNGQYYDSLIHSILRLEWEKKQKEVKRDVEE